ncbi:MAG: ABC transporter ATP-binding protein [Myxococcales bacterium]|nr:ABC transporter ATP-binding protein [Myxococcales bacterium]
MIEVSRLTKAFGPRIALDDVNFTIQKGEIVGFLGPNGAGKTTTMRILTGYIPATAGVVRVAGYDVFDEPYEVRERVGYLPETPPIYPELSVGAYLQFCAELRRVPKARRATVIGDTMERVGLRGWERRLLGSLSKGFRQRVGLAQALLHDPSVLILDEPTSGLDPAQLAGIRELILSLAGTHTVILSTHILSEVDALCPRAIIIDRGRVVAQGTLSELRAQAPGGAWTYVEVRGIEGPRLGSLPGIARVEPLPDADGWAAWCVRSSADPREQLAARAAAGEFQLRALERRAPTLEEAFIHIVGREGAEA